MAHASLAAPALLPTRACRALWLSLSDLALRCWPAQPAAQFDAEARSAAFTSLVAPLVQLFQQAAAAASGGGGLAGEAAAAARSAASACACIVQSYSDSPKALRSIVGAALAAPALPSVVAILHATGSGSAGGGPLRSKAAMALLRLVTACLDVLATELGTEGVEQLLAALVQVFSATGKQARCWGQHSGEGGRVAGLWPPAPTSTHTHTRHSRPLPRAFPPAPQQAQTPPLRLTCL